jgi:hypothetical protein
MRAAVAVKPSAPRAAVLLALTGLWACAPTVARTNVVLTGHRATMDALGYVSVGEPRDGVIARSQTRSPAAIPAARS